FALALGMFAASCGETKTEETPVDTAAMAPAVDTTAAPAADTTAPAAADTTAPAATK
ncbi:MAG: hypothetical protein RLZ39_516, partial [Bacteroidota bacterium]